MKDSTEARHCNKFNNNLNSVRRVLSSRNFAEWNWWGLPGNLLQNLFFPEKRVHTDICITKMFYLSLWFILV